MKKILTSIGLAGLLLAPQFVSANDENKDNKELIILDEQKKGEIKDDLKNKKEELKKDIEKAKKEVKDKLEK